MPSASSYINKIRVATEARNVKVQYPGRIGNLTQSLRSITCNIPSSRWNPIEYKEVCGNACKPQYLDVCEIPEQRYDSGEAIGVGPPCSIMDGQGIYTDTPPGTVVLDAGEECVV